MSLERAVIPQADMERYRATARVREAARKADLEAHRARALAVARAGAELLRADFGATEVILFGSLARGGPVSWRSDADLAARGVTGDRFFTAVGRLQSLDPVVSVDLVRLEDAPEALLAVIAAEGRPL